MIASRPSVNGYSRAPAHEILISTGYIRWLCQLAVTDILILYATDFGVFVRHNFGFSGEVGNSTDHADKGNGIDADIVANDDRDNQCSDTGDYDGFDVGLVTRE
jgi:hypothetical protein